MSLKITSKYYKRVLKLAIPVTLAQVGVQMISIVDAIMVGKLGKTELAAIAFGGSVYFFFFLFLIGCVIGLTTIVGSLFLKNRERKIAVIFQNSLLLYTLLGIIFFVLLYFSRFLILENLNQPPEVVTLAMPYYEYMILSIIPFMVYAAFKHLFEGIGNTTANMIMIFTVNIVNIFLNWVFIYGNLGMPQMGGAGAGLAALIATSLLPILAFLYSLINKYTKQLYSFFAWNNFSFFKIKKLLLLGFPIGIQLFIENFAFVATSIMTGWMSISELAANQIAIKMASLSFMIVLGINSAVTILVSHEFGVKNLPEIKQYSFVGYRLTCIWSAIIITIFIVFRYFIAEIFVSEQEVIAIAANLMICVAIFQLSDGIQSVSLGILRGLQDVKPLIYISILAYIIIDLPLGYFLAFTVGLKSAGLWISFFFGLTLAAILYYLRIKKNFKQLSINQL